MLATVARSLTGSDGEAGINTTHGAGGGAGGLSLLIANKVVYGAGVIDVSGGDGGNTGISIDNRGGDGRVIQLYFDAFASDLMVVGGVQSQFRLLRSPTAGQAVLF